MNKFRQAISDTTRVIIQDDGGMIEIWNDLEDGETGIGLLYAEIPALINALRDAQSYIFDHVQHDALAVRYLLLSQGVMATKDIIEDIVMRRWDVERGMIHEILNLCSERGVEGSRWDEYTHEWKWDIRYGAKPKKADYPEIDIILAKN